MLLLNVLELFKICNKQNKHLQENHIVYLDRNKCVKWSVIIINREESILYFLLKECNYNKFNQLHTRMFNKCKNKNLLQAILIF